jgi:hypothetical protein
MEIFTYLARQAQEHLLDMISSKLRWVCETDPTSETNYLKITGSIVKVVEYVLIRYTIALTSAGKIVVVPLESSVGDHMIHFRNAVAPCVLRPNAGASTFRFLGGAYLESWVNDHPATERNW